MVSSSNCESCFVVISNAHAYTEPTVGELIPPLLPSQRAGKGACDITGRDPHS